MPFVKSILVLPEVNNIEFTSACPRVLPLCKKLQTQFLLQRVKGGSNCYFCHQG